MKALLIGGFLAVIVWNLFAGLYYMLADSRPTGNGPARAGSKRTVNALTRRIGWSVALILLVAAGIAAGVIQPHGVG